MAEYHIELINSALETVGLLSAPHGFSFALALGGLGRNGALALHLDDPLAPEIIAGSGSWYVRFYRDGVYLRAFLVEQITYGYGAGDDYIALTLVPLEQIFKRAWGVASVPGGKFISPSLPLDDAIKWVVDHACGPNAYDSPASGEARAIAGLVIDAYASAHPTSEAVDSADRKCLYEFLTKFASAYEIDFSLELEPTTGNDNRLIFYTYYPRRGVDRTLDNGVVTPVLLNDASVHLPEGERQLNFTGVTAVISQDLLNEVRDATTEAVHGRYELLAQTKDAKEMEALLEKNKLREGEEWHFVESDALRVIQDFTVGDLVSVNNIALGIPTHDETVREIFFQVDPNGVETIRLTLGDYAKTLLDRVDEHSTGGGGGADIWDTGEWEDHPPVSLEDNDDVKAVFELDVAMQILGLDTQGANKFLAGPTSGAAAIPTFRTIANVDLGTNEAAGRFLKIGASGREWADVLAMGITPDTLTVSTTNAITGGKHTHAITSSANPGVAASLLATDANGLLTLAKLQIGTSIRPTVNNTVSLGDSTYRWSNVYTVLLNHSGDKATFRGVEYTLPSSSANGVLCNSGGTLSWSGPAYVTHVHNYTKVTDSTIDETSGVKTSTWTISGSPDYTSNPLRKNDGTILYYDAGGHINTTSGTTMHIGATKHYHYVKTQAADTGAAE